MPMDRAMLPHAKSTMSRCTPSIIKGAFHDTDTDTRDSLDLCEDVGVGVVECGLYQTTSVGR